jgi:hypothetical protein
MISELLKYRKRVGVQERLKQRESGTVKHGSELFYSHVRRWSRGEGKSVVWKKSPGGQAEILLLL